MYQYMNLRRCARGMSAVFAANNFGAAALYNDSSSAQLLKVWRATDTLAAGNHFYQTYLLQGRLTTHDSGVVVPLITGDPRPPGRIDTQDLLTIPSADYALSTLNANDTTLANNFPFCVLSAGWSLVLVIDASGVGTFQGAFIWEWCYPEDLISPTIGDPTIDRASRLA